MISVIIPTWNRERTVKRAVVSVLDQSSPVSEILVCDDGSTDSSRDSVKSIGDTRVRWIEGKHSGLPAVPRNRGIQESRGEWLAFLDSDDEWLPDKLAIQLAAVAKTGCGAVSSDALTVSPCGKVSGTVHYDRMEKRQFAFPDILNRNSIVCSTMMIRRDILMLTGGFPEERNLAAMEDYALWLRVADSTDIAYITIPLVRYLDDPVNSIRSEALTVYSQRRRILGNFMKWGVKNRPLSPNLWRTVVCDLIERICRRNTARIQ